MVTLLVAENGEGKREQKVGFRAEDIPFPFPKNLISHMVYYFYIDFVIYERP